MSTYDLLNCFNDEVFFIENFFMAQNPFKGKSLISLTPKELKILKEIHRMTFVVDAIQERQIGTSTMFAAHALWLTTFNSNTTVVLMDERQYGVENLRLMVKYGYEHLPEFIQEQKITDNKRTMEFGNGSRILFMGSNPDNLQGRTVNYIFLDNFEFYAPARIKALYEYSDMFAHKFKQLVLI